jgi:hypothetical protein
MSRHLPWSGLEPPAPPRELRRRTLAATAAAWRRSEGAAARHWVDRLWESRGARLAWTAAMGLLIWLQVLLSAPGSTSKPSAPSLPTPWPESLQAEIGRLPETGLHPIKRGVKDPLARYLELQ